MISYGLGYGLSVKDKNSWDGIVKVYSKIIAGRQRDSCSLWETQVAQKAKWIISQSGHVLASEFTVMPSRWCHNVALRRTNHYSKSFIPSTISLLNANSSHFNHTKIEHWKEPLSIMTTFTLDTLCTFYCSYLWTFAQVKLWMQNFYYQWSIFILQ